MHRGTSLQINVLLEVRKVTPVDQEGPPRGGWKQSAHPMRLIVSRTNRHNLIKSFQTSFGPHYGAQKKRPPPLHRAHLTPRWSEAGGVSYTSSKVSPQITVMRLAGVSLTVSASLSPPPLFPALVVKNSLAAVCVACARMSPPMADCVAKGIFRGLEGIDGAPSERRGALRSFDVTLRDRDEICESLDGHRLRAPWLQLLAELVQPKFARQMFVFGSLSCRSFVCLVLNVRVSNYRSFYGDGVKCDKLSPVRKIQTCNRD